jgi:hypothetical protein
VAVAAFRKRVQAASTQVQSACTQVQDAFTKKHKDAPDWIERATKIIGLVAGLGAFVYITGAAVLAVRLDTAGLPATDVVSGLPRELLIGVGLQYVVAPAVALALVAGLQVLLLRLWLRGDQKTGRKVVGILIGGFLLTAFILWIVLSFQRWERPWTLGVLGWLAAWVAVYVATLLVYVAHKGKREPLVLMALIALSVGLIAAAARVVSDRENHRLKEATVCINDGGPNYEGLLVGETSSAVYLGRVEEGLILAVPKERVGELRIGDMSSWSCSVPRPTQDGGRRT